MILRKKFKELPKELQNLKSRETNLSLIFPTRTRFCYPSNYRITIIRVKILSTLVISFRIHSSYYAYEPKTDVTGAIISTKTE